jgi:hypothetical protein
MMSKKSLMLGGLCLLLTLMPLFSQETLDQYNEALLETYLDHADEQRSREDWQEMALYGVDAVVAEWEAALGGLILDDAELAAFKAAVQEDIQEEVDRRYLNWIVQGYQNSLRNSEMTLIGNRLNQISSDYIYKKDNEGNVLYDASGNPELLEFADFFDLYQDNADGTRTLVEEGEGTLWREAARDAIKEILDGWRQSYWDGAADLENGLDAQQQQELRERLTQDEGLYFQHTQGEMERAFLFEQQAFRNARLADNSSLRNRYDNLTAEALTQQMIDDIKAQTAIDIQNLQESLATAIENPAPGTEISVTEWQKSFQAELDKGLGMWDEAEEQFFAQRLQWEQNASQTFAQRDQEWADAFQSLKNARRDWTLEFQKTIEKGVELWEERLGDLSGSIQTAKNEILENISQEQGSLEGRIQTLIDMMAQSVDMMRSARDNFMYWEDHLHPSDFAGDAMGWDPLDMRKELLYSVLRETRGPSYQAELENQLGLDQDLQFQYEAAVGARDATHASRMAVWDDDRLQEERDWLQAFQNYINYDGETPGYKFEFYHRFTFVGKYGGDYDDEESMNRIINDLLSGDKLVQVFEDKREEEVARYDRVMADLNAEYYGRGGLFDQRASAKEQAMIDAQPFQTEELTDLWKNLLNAYWTGLNEEAFGDPQFWSKTLTHVQDAANPYSGAMAEERKDLLLTALAAIDQADFSAIAPLPTEATDQMAMQHSKTMGYLAQSRYWLEEVYLVYRDYADQGMMDLAELYGVVVFDDPRLQDIAGPDTAGILGEGWENILMDDYQKEVLKAKALEAFWAKELRIAQEVTAYALDNTGNRESEDETNTNLNNAQKDYDAALKNYNKAVAELQGYQDQMGENQQAIDLIRQKLEEKAAELDEAKSEYHQLLAIYRLDESASSEGGFQQKYDQLLRLLGVIEDEDTTSRAQAMAEYLAALARYEGEGRIEVQAARMDLLINGATVSEDPGAPVILSMAALKAQVQNVQDFALPLDGEGELAPLSIEGFRDFLRDSLYLDSSNPVFQTLVSAYQFTFLTDAETGSSNNWANFMAQVMPTLREIQLGAQAELASREAELGLYSAPSLEAWGERYFASGVLTNTAKEEVVISDAQDYSRSLLEAQVRSVVDQDLRWMRSLALSLETESVLQLIPSLTQASGYAQWAQNPEDWMAWSYYNREASLLRDDFDPEALLRKIEGYLTALEELEAILDLGGSFADNAGALRDWKAENGGLEIYLRGQGIYNGEAGAYSSLLVQDSGTAYQGALAIERMLQGASQGKNLLGAIVKEERAKEYIKGLQDRGILQGSSSLRDPLQLWNAQGFSQVSEVRDYLRDLQTHMAEYGGSLPGYMEEALANHAQAIGTFFAAQSLTLSGTLDTNSEELENLIEGADDHLVVLQDLYDEVTAPGAEQLSVVSALLGAGTLEAQDARLAEEAWTEALAWTAVEASYSLDSLDLGDSSAIQDLLVSYGAEAWNSPGDLTALVSTVQTLALDYQSTVALMLEEELSPAELAALSPDELRLVKWGQWQNLSPLAVWEGLTDPVYNGSGEYVLALYAVDQYLADNPFTNTLELQDALGDLFLEELYGGRTLARDMVGYGFMDEQALWLTGDSSWELLVSDLVDVGDWVFAPDGTSLPSQAQWQAYYDQIDTLTDPADIRTTLGLGTAGIVLDDPDSWLANAEYISRILESFDRVYGGTEQQRQSLASDLLNILEVSLSGEERNDLAGLHDEATQNSLISQYLQGWDVSDWRSLNDTEAELYLRAQLEKTVAQAAADLAALDPEANLSEDEIQILIYQWKSQNLYTASADKQRAYSRLAAGLQDDLGLTQGSSADFHQKVLELLVAEQEAWGLDPEGDRLGDEEIRRTFALGLYAGSKDGEIYSGDSNLELGRWILSGLGLAAEDATLSIINSDDEALIYQRIFGSDGDLRDFVIKDAVVNRGWSRDEVVSRFGIIPAAELEEFIRLAGISSRYLQGIDEDVADYWDSEYQVSMNRESELKAHQAAGYQRAWVDEFFLAEALGTQLSPQEAYFEYEISGSRLAEEMKGLYSGLNRQGGFLDALVMDSLSGLQDLISDQQDNLMGLYSELAFTSQLEGLLERLDPADLNPSWRYYLTVVNLLPEGENWQNPSEQFLYDYKEPTLTDQITRDANASMVTNTSAQTTLIQEAYNEALASANMAKEAFTQKAVMEGAEGPTALMTAWAANQSSLWTDLGNGSALTIGDWTMSQGVREEFDRAGGQYRGITGTIDNLKGELALLGKSLETYYAEKETDVDVMVAPIKAQIEEIQWEMAVLDELWDELILGDPGAWRVRVSLEAQGSDSRRDFVLGLVEEVDPNLVSYQALEEDYATKYKSISESYQLLEAAKEEYQIRKGIYEYASSGYLTDGSDLDLDEMEEADLQMYQMLIASTPLDRLRRAQSQYRMARASLDALERIEQDHQDHLVDLYADDPDYQLKVDNYIKHFKSKIALAEMERILAEAMAEKDRQTEEAYAAWKIELEKIFGGAGDAISGILATKHQEGINVEPYLPEDVAFEDLDTFKQIEVLLKAQDGPFAGFDLQMQEDQLSSISWDGGVSGITVDEVEDYFGSTSRHQGYLHDLHMYSQYLHNYKDNNEFATLLETWSLALSWEMAPQDDYTIDPETGEMVFGEDFTKFIEGAANDPAKALNQKSSTEAYMYNKMKDAYEGLSGDKLAFYNFYKLQILTDSGFELGDMNMEELRKTALNYHGYDEARRQTEGKKDRYHGTAVTFTSLGVAATITAAAFWWNIPMAIYFGGVAAQMYVVAAVNWEQYDKYNVAYEQSKYQRNLLQKDREEAQGKSKDVLDYLDSLRDDYEDKKTDLDLMSGAADEVPNNLDDLTDAILKAYEVSDKDLSTIGGIADFTANRAGLRGFLAQYYTVADYSEDDLEDNRRLLTAVQRTADQSVQDAYDEREAYLWDNSPENKGLAVRYQEAVVELETLEAEFQERGVVDEAPNSDQLDTDLGAWQTALENGSDATALRIALVEHARALLAAYDDPNMAGLGLSGASAFRYESGLSDAQEYEYYAPNQALWTIKQAYEDYINHPSDPGADYIASLLLDYQERYQLYQDYLEKLDEVHGAQQTYNQRHTQTQLYKTFANLYNNLTDTDSESPNILNSSSSIVLDEMNRILAGSTRTGADHSGLLEYSRSQYTEVKFYELDLLYNETALEAGEWQDKMDSIFYRGMIEWNKSEREFTEKWNNWRKAYMKEFEAKSQEWQEEYLEFVSDKSTWVKDMTVASTQIGSNLNTLSDETTTAITTAMESAVTDILIASEEDPNSIANRLMNNGLFAQLSDAGSKLLGTVGENRFAFNTALRRTGFDSAGAMKDFKDYQQVQNEEMKNRLAALQLEKMIDSFQARIDGIALRVDDTNDYWDEHTEDSLTAAGFRRVGTTFQKHIVTGSTIQTALIRELREIQQYQDLVYETPDLETASGIRNYGLVYDFDAVQALIANATQVVEAEEERVFGTGVREWRAKGGAWAERDEAPDLTKTSEQKKGWQNKGDGLFGDHVGYAPVYKSGKDLDMDAGRSKNIKYKGSGELGRILGYLSWYNMEEGAGYSQVNLPGYKKPLWDTFEIIPGWEMEAPSLMGVVDMSVSVIAAVVTAPVGGIGGTAISAAINSIDDLVFTAAEVSGGYISPEQGWLNAGKIFAQAGVTVLMDGLMNGWNTWDATDPTKAISGGIFGEIGDNFWGKALATFGQQMVTNGANGLINSTNFAFDDNGNITGLETDMEAWGDSVFGENAWAGYASSFVGSAVTAGLNDLMPKLNLQGYEADLDEIGVKKLGILSSTIGGLAGELASMAFDGEFTVNLLNLSDIARIFGAGDEAASRLNKGLFEVGIGWDDDGDFGVRSRFGSGGASLNIGGLIGVWDVFGNVQRKNEEIQARVDAAKERGRELREERQSVNESEPPPGEEDEAPIFSAEDQVGETPYEPEIDWEREGKKDDVEGIMENFDEKSPNEQKDAIKELEEYLNEDGQIDSAEEFMKDMVTEEGLQAFDFSAIVEEMVENGEWSAEKTLEIEDHLEDIEDLKVRFEQALVLALSDSQEQLQSRLAFGDPTFFAYTSKLNELQDLGILNDHEIFNPFERMATRLPTDEERVKMEELGLTAPEYFRHEAMQTILKNYLAFSRVVPITDRDGNKWHIIIDARARSDGDDGTLGTGNLLNTANKGSAETLLVSDIDALISPSGIPYVVKVNEFNESNNSNENPVKLVTTADEFVFPEEIFGPGLEDVSLLEARMATYNFDQLQNAINARDEAILRTIYQSIDSDLYWDEEEFAASLRYRLTERTNMDNSVFQRYLAESYDPGNPNYSYNQEILKQQDYVLLIEQMESNHRVFGFEWGPQNQVHKAYTNCNTLIRTFSSFINDPRITGVETSDLADVVFGSFRRPEGNNLQNSSYFTEVSPIYGALLGKLNGFSLVESPPDGYPAPHINRYSNVELYDPNNPDHAGMENYIFTYTEKYGTLNDLGEAKSYDFVFSYDNSGEWLGMDLPMNLAWGRPMEEYMATTRSFMFTPFGNRGVR